MTRQNKLLESSLIEEALLLESSLLVLRLRKDRKLLITIDPQQIPRVFFS